MISHVPAYSVHTVQQNLDATRAFCSDQRNSHEQRAEPRPLLVSPPDEHVDERMWLQNFNKQHLYSWAPCLSSRHTSLEGVCGYLLQQKRRGINTYFLSCIFATFRIMWTSTWAKACRKGITSATGQIVQYRLRLLPKEHINPRPSGFFHSSRIPIVVDTTTCCQAWR